MTIRKFLISVMAGVSSLGLIVGCSPKEGSGISYPFTVNIDVVDGEMYVDGVLRRPSISFTAVSEDKTAVYDMVYSVDGADEKWLRGLPIAKSWNIDSEFSSIDSYGEHEVRGRVILQSDTRRSVTFSAKFWMKYSAVDISKAYFQFPKGTVELKDNAELMTGSSGNVVIEYTPSRSYAEITAKTLSDGVLRLDSSTQTNEGGVFSIPFVVEGEGVSNLSFVFRNGNDEMEVSYRITCGPDKGYDDLVLNLESRDLVLPGVPLDVNLEVRSGDLSRLFNIDYFIDGEPSASDKDVSLSPAATKTLDWSGLSVGTHTVGVKVSLVGGSGLPLERETTFMVADPALSVTGGAYAGNVIRNGGSLTLDAGMDYVLSVTGIPDAFAERFRLDCDPSSLNEVGDGLWSFSPKTYGKEALKFVYSYDDKDVCIATLDVFGLALSVRDFVIPGLPLDVTLGVSSGSSQTLFNVDYYIDGTLSASDKDVSLSPAAKRTLDWSSLEAGKHSVSVKASPVDGVGVALEREESFEVAAPALAVTGGPYEGTPLSEGASLTLDSGKEYALALKGVPEAFVSRFVVKCDAESIKSTGTGLWAFSPKKSGKGALTLTYSHGGSEVQIASLDVVGLDLSVREFVIPGLSLDVKLGVSFGGSSSLFNVDYFIDGELAASDRDISLSPAAGRTLDWSSVTAGTHKVSVKASPVGGAGQPLEREASFTVSDPSLSVNGGAYKGTSLKDGKSLVFDAGAEYSLSLTGVPDAFVGRFKMVSDPGSVSDAGAGKWKYAPKTYGKEVVKFMYSFNGEDVHIASFDAVRLQFGVRDFVMKGVTLESSVVADLGKSTGLFDVDYYIDGKLVLSEKNISLASSVSKTFDWSSLSAGAHKLGVKAGLVGGNGSAIEREGTFNVCVPSVSVTGGAYKDTAVKDGGSLMVDGNAAYAVSLAGVPDGYIGRFKVVSDIGSISEAGAGKWNYSPKTYGKEVVKIVYSHNDEELVIARFDAVRVEFAVSDFVMKGLTLESGILADLGKSTGLFDVDYLIDGKLVVSEKGLSLASSVSKTFDWSALAAGTHKLGVKVNLVGSNGSPIEREGAFDVCVPGLKLNGGSYSDADASAGGSFIFVAGTGYVFTLTGVGEAFVGRFAMQGDKSPISVSENGSWTVSPQVYGRETLKFVYAYKKSQIDIASMDVLRTDVCDVTLTWNYDVTSSYKNSDCTVSDCSLKASVQGKYATLVEVPMSGKIVYHGYMEYPDATRAFRPTDSHTNTKKEDRTASQEVSFSTNIATAVPESVLDLTSRIQGLIGKGNEARYWTRWSIEEGTVVYDSDLGIEAEEMFGYFFYNLIVDSVSLESVTKYEGLSYRLDVKNLSKSVLTLGDGWVLGK